MSIFEKLFNQKSEIPESNSPDTGDNNNNIAPVEGLDKYQNLWDQKPAEPDSTGFNIDPNKFMEVANQVDFSQVISPEIISKIGNGGQEGITAALEAMNSIARATYGQTSLAAASMVEATYKKAQSDMSKLVESKIKALGVKDKLVEENPIYNHSATKPFIEALQIQLSRQFPEASAADIAAATKEYLKDFANAVSPAKPESKGDKHKEIDWSEFI